MEMVRDRLRARFGPSSISDAFDGGRRAWVLDVIDEIRRHRLIIPEDTLRDEHFAFEVNDRFLEILRLAGSLPVIVTSHGVSIEVPPGHDVPGVSP